MTTLNNLEVTISAAKAQNWAYCEEFITEDEVLLRARLRAEELGCHPVSTGVGAFLQAQVAALQARAIVEIGTGTGVSGVWMMRGMGTDGVLTTIEVDAENQRAARTTFTEANIPTNRLRLITGEATTVLPRLSDAAYDMVLVDANKEDLQEYVDQATRLLRPGGGLVIDNALWGDKVANPAQRDHVTGVIRDVCRNVRDGDQYAASLLPIGDGVLLAVRLPNS